MHRLWQWKKSIFSFFFLLCLYLFTLPLLTKAVDWYLSSHCQECLGADFTAEKYSWHSGGFVIQNTVLSSKKSLDEGGYHITMPRMHVSFDISLWKRTIDLTMALESPHFQFGEHSKKFLESLSLGKEKKGYLPFKSKLKVNNGKIPLNDNSDLEIDLDIDFSSSPTGNFYVNFNDKKNSVREKLFEGILLQDTDESILEIAFGNTNTVFLYEMLQFFHLTKSFSISQGTLNGLLAFSIEEKNQHLKSAAVEFSNLTASSRKDHITLEAPKIHFDWHDNEGRIVSDEKGKLSINNPKDGNIEFCNLQSEVNVNSFGNGYFLCKGQGCYRDIAFDCSFFGEKIADKNACFTMDLKGKDKQFISLHGMGNPFDKNFCHLVVKNFQKQEFDLIKNLFGKSYKPLSHLEMNKGSIDLSLTATLNNGLLEEISLDGIKAHNIALKLVPADIEILIDQLDGIMNQETSTSASKPHDGIIEIKGLHARNSEQVVILENISTLFAINNGRIENVSALGDFFGLKGSLKLIPENKGHELSLDLQGNILELARFLPIDTTELLKKKYIGDKVAIRASGVQNGKAIDINGIFTVTDAEKQKNYDLNFSFAIKPPNESYEIDDKWLQNGKFNAEGLSFGKFIAPFVFEREQFELRGKGDLNGKFDQQMLSIDYVAKNFCLESDSLCLDVPKLSVHDSKAKASGSHSFNFRDGKHSGELFIENGEYFEKNSGLYFGKIHTKVFSDDNIIQLKEIKTTCCGLELEGEISIDCQEPLEKTYGVSILCNSMKGKLSALKFMLAHFNALKIPASLPLEGDVSLSNEKWALDFLFSPEKVAFHTNIVGLLENGFNDTVNDNFAIENLSFKFSYDHNNNLLSFDNLKGNLNLALHNQLYSLDNGKITFSDISKGEAKFDIPLYSQSDVALRVKGITENNQDGGLDFHFDTAESHIFNCHPTLCELAVDRFGHIKDFCIEIPLELSKIKKELATFIKSGSFNSLGISEYYLDTLLNSSGSLIATLKYNNEHDQLLYQLKGENCTFGSHNINQFTLSGNKKGALWSIEKLELDDLSLAADLLRENGKWIFKFLGFQLNDSLLVGMQGEYNTEQSFFEGYINLLEGNIEEVKNIEPLRELCEKCQLRGFFKACGPVRFEPMGSWPYWKIETTLSTSITNPSAFGVQFLELNPFSIRLTSDGRLCVDKIQSSFHLPSSQITFEDPKVGNNFISATNIEWDCITQAMRTKDLQFSIAPESMSFIADQLQTAFPEHLDSNIVKGLANCKKQGPIQGRCSFDTCSNGNICRLELAKGIYVWNDSEYEINNFAFEYDKEALRTVFNSCYRDHHFWCFLNVPTEDMSCGQLFFSDNFLTKVSIGDIQKRALVVDWQKDSKMGFSITKAQGSFGGLEIDLFQDDSHPPRLDIIPLSGKMSIDLKRSAKLLAKETRQGFADWNIGNKYDLIGRFEIKKENKGSHDDTFNFLGILSGTNVECYGYKFASLQAQVNYSFNCIDITQIELHDAAGDLEIPRATLVDRGFGFELDAKRIDIRYLRPSLLCVLETPDLPEITPLVIQIEINNLQGMLANPETFTAMGIFSFNNRSKKTPHPLFVIPSEILHCLGLDLSLLSPVSGQVFYNIRNGKIFLTKLKDVYSEGKFSRFYLDTRVYYSYIDFKGNIDIQVRMKQYNLLFKLAELLTVNVTGTVKNPLYSLKKQAQKGQKKVKALL